MLDAMALAKNGKSGVRGASRESGKSDKPTPRPTLAEIGKAAAREAQRAALLKELRTQNWNLSATAESLGLSNASNVIRAINSLDLADEYEAAKDAGKIPRGPRA